MNDRMRCDLNTTIANLRLGFQVIDSEWRYVYVNPAAAAHGRRRVTDLIGHTIFEMYPGIEQTPVFECLRSSMVDRTYQNFDTLFTFPDGESRWFDIRVEPVPEGICVYSLDVHERKLEQIALEADSFAPGKHASLPLRLWDAFVR